MNNYIQLKKTHARCVSQNFQRPGIAPVIATLLLVAIAVVGGSIVFVFAQEFFTGSQISGTPSIELIKIIGYDASDAEQVKAHDGIDILPSDCCGESDRLKNVDERIAIYLQNNSVEQVFISEIRISGAVYDFTTYTVFPAPGIGSWNMSNVKPQQGEYVILTGHDGTVGGDLLEFPAPVMQPGELITVLADLDQRYNIPRDVQFKLTTSNGAVFVSTIIMGQYSG